MTDLELMRLLEDEGYEATLENLEILKEGLENGTLEILDEARREVKEFQKNGPFKTANSYYNRTVADRAKANAKGTEVSRLYSASEKDFDEADKNWSPNKKWSDNKKRETFKKYINSALEKEKEANNSKEKGQKAKSLSKNRNDYQSDDFKAYMERYKTRAAGKYDEKEMLRRAKASYASSQNYKRKQAAKKEAAQAEAAKSMTPQQQLKAKLKAKYGPLKECFDIVCEDAFLYDLQDDKEYILETTLNILYENDELESEIEVAYLLEMCGFESSKENIEIINESLFNEDYEEEYISDYELYKLLESEGYETTNENLEILKEGLYSGEIEILNEMRREVKEFLKTEDGKDLKDDTLGSRVHAIVNIESANNNLERRAVNKVVGSTGENPRFKRARDVAAKTPLPEKERETDKLAKKKPNSTIVKLYKKKIKELSSK